VILSFEGDILEYNIIKLTVCNKKTTENGITSHSKEKKANKKASVRFDK